MPSTNSYHVLYAVLIYHFYILLRPFQFTINNALLHEPLIEYILIGLYWHFIE